MKKSAAAHIALVEFFAAVRIYDTEHRLFNQLIVRLHQFPRRDLIVAPRFDFGVRHKTYVIFSVFD